MRHNFSVLLQIPWLLAGIVWACGWRKVKRTERAEPPRDRLLHLALIASSFLLLFSTRIRVGVLELRIVPEKAWILYLGFALTLTGVMVAIWSRISLGRNWSGVVTIKAAHSLVQHGPYSKVRHPIYSGFLLAMVGTAMAYGRVACLVAVPLGFIAWWTKSQNEERFLVAQFGDAYTNYQHTVRALIPFIL